jgi:lycopene beta-cyclase
MSNFDYVLVGGGLQNALVVEALLSKRPGTRIALVERGSALGGNHTWCFHAGDVPDKAARFVEALVVQSWSRYRVEFPDLSRTVTARYAAVTSRRLDEVVIARVQSSGLTVFLNAPAVRVEPGRVTLASGATLDGEVVIDARGPEFQRESSVGFQKFVGLELEVRVGSGPADPILMDARVEQTDGFRFFYVLPLANDRVLVEDTYFSDSPELELARLRSEILGYAGRTGLEVRGTLREEVGVLPLPARAPRPRLPEPGLVVGGYQGGFFHPTTGYSFPVAVRFALEVARSRPEELPGHLQRLARAEARQQRFATLLNRMLFRGFAPELRYRVLERFYRLPVLTIERFYALALTPADRARIVCGRPPRGLSVEGLLSAVLPHRAGTGRARGEIT